MTRVAACFVGLILFASPGLAECAACVEPAAAGAALAALADPLVPSESAQPVSDAWSTVFVFVLATFIGIGVIGRVSRLLHTPLMSLTNAISAIAVVGSILVAGGDYPTPIRVLGAVALFASMTNIVGGFLITNRMLKMFKQKPRAGTPK